MMFGLIRKRAGLVVAGLLAALCPMLMAPTGGIPSLLTLQGLNVGSGLPFTPITGAVQISRAASPTVFLYDQAQAVNQHYVSMSTAGGSYQVNACPDSLSGCTSMLAIDKGFVWAPHCVYKHGTESRFSTTTLAADTNLSITINTNGYYKHTMWIELGAGGAGAGGFKWNFSGTAATSGRGESGWRGAAFANQEVSVLATTSSFVALSTAQNDWIKTEGVMHITSAPQTIALQWAQNSSSSDTTSVLGDSYMCLDRIE